MLDGVQLIVARIAERALPGWWRGLHISGKRRKADLDDRLYRTYDKMDEMKNLIAEAKAKRRSILADKMSGDNIYKALISFDKLYEKMSETEKRAFYEKLIKEVQVYEERQPSGQWLKSIELPFTME